MSAMKCFPKDEGFIEQQLRREIVNYIVGDIANQNGFRARAMECTWSVTKQWIRQKMSSTLPAHSGCQKWTLLIDEFQGRSMLKTLASQSLDKGNTRVVSFHDVV